MLKDIELAFEGLDEDLANNQLRWNSEVKKAKEHRDRERLEKLLKKWPKTNNSTHWESETEKVHGRIEKHICTVMPVGDLPSKEGWEGIQSIARLCRERTKNGQTSQEITYYITSLKPIAALIAEIAKNYWGVEVQHWYLDVVFRQDKSRYRNRIGARNLAILRKIALNALLREKSLKRVVLLPNNVPQLATLLIEKRF